MRAQATVHSVSEWRRFRELVLSLTWRDLRVRYRQSLLGITWAVLLPLSMMLVFTFVFTRAIPTQALFDVQMPYPLFAYVGIVPWTFFASSVNGCTNSLVANRNLVTKVYFPREVFPLSCVASSFVDFMLAMSVLAGLMAYFHWRGEWTYAPHVAVLFVPVVVFIQIMLTVGIGMALAMANLFYRDVRHVVGVVIQLCMFISAVVVPVPQDGSLLSRVMSLNPLVHIIGAYRDCLVHGRFPEPVPLAYAAVVATVLCAGGWACFRRASSRFAECI